MDLSFDDARQQLVERQLVRRGIMDRLVLQAFRRVPREQFLPPALGEFAYRDTALPIAEGQTISQPYIVAVMAEALALTGTERVLEVGAGSGYAAAILSHIAGEVFTIERHESLAEVARGRLARLGHSNVHVIHGDGTLGLPEHAPYAAIVVAAGAPEVPRALLEQLAPGGRLVIPVGPDESRQVLTRIVREGEGFREEPLQPVRFVPLIGEQSWRGGHRPLASPGRRGDVPTLIREVAEPLSGADTASRAIDGLIERIADARLVLLGESTHGTSEFYRFRARVTRELIDKKGFSFVAVEADWPDAARIDAAIAGRTSTVGPDFVPFARFPTWMWRNREVVQLTRWLYEHNRSCPAEARVRFHGLDLYSMFTSIAAVLHYLGGIDPDAADVARTRYGTLTPWQSEPTAYGQAVLVGRYASSEAVVVSTLQDLLARRLDYAARDGERFFDAAQNARVVAGAEAYYRAMYYGSSLAWNLRDRHMFETLERLMRQEEHAKGIVWAHNSHLGDARATDMAARDELNVGQLCRESFGQSVFIVGFGTDHGTVAAASRWGGELEFQQVRPAHEQSYERLCHDSEVPAFVMHLREPHRRSLREELSASRLERAIGVIYRPDTELASHYCRASLPRQFDEYVWFDETSAVAPLAPPREPSGAASSELPETFPFGL